MTEQPASPDNQPAGQPADSSAFTHLHFVIVFVRDQEQSLRFYVDKLGFTVLIDMRLGTGQRWLELAPPDGLARLALVMPERKSTEESLIGRYTGIFFLTADVQHTFQQWQSRGVKFLSPPEQPALGVMTTRFEDIDGNTFGLAGIDEVTREVEAKRQLAAGRAEAERRASQELEIAKQVQARLFPQAMPRRQTLDYSGTCIQARQVGGDYYDFLDFDGQRLGFVIADISGKGIGAALLMASLQSSLRSQFAASADNPRQLLCSANQIFHDNTQDATYATLLLAAYDEGQSRLTYINCGHLPALLLRNDGRREWLESTATVLGLFREWDCEVETRQLHPGDIFVLYTDGITEASDAEDHEFGRNRIAEIVREHRTLAARGIVSAIVDEVRRFSVDEQQDDITVIVVKRN